MVKPKYYAVRVGRIPGIYNSWEDCVSQVHKYSNAEFKRFSSRKEAEEYVSGNVQPLIANLQAAPEPPVLTKRSREEPSTSFRVAENVLYRLEFDGAARQNPGPAGAGAVLYVDSCDDEVGRVCVGMGRATNNVAEYTALVKGLEAAVEIGVKRLKVVGDSNLVVQQVIGTYKVNNEGLRPLHRRVLELQQHFTYFSIDHIYRDANKVADALSNEAIDTGGWSGLKTAEGIVEVGPNVPPDSSQPGASGGSRMAATAAGGSQMLIRRMLQQPQSQPPAKSMMGGSWAARRNGISAVGGEDSRRSCSTAALGSLSAAAACCMEADSAEREGGGAGSLDPPGPSAGRSCGGGFKGWEAARREQISMWEGGSWWPRQPIQEMLWGGFSRQREVLSRVWSDERVGRQRGGLTAVVSVGRRLVGSHLALERGRSPRRAGKKTDFGVVGRCMPRPVLLGCSTARLSSCLRVVRLGAHV